MTKVLVLYYSSYGHVEALAHAVAEGARAAGALADVKRVPELVPEQVCARRATRPANQQASRACRNCLTTTPS